MQKQLRGCWMQILNHNLIVNHKCNMNCEYCYVKNKNEESLDIKTANKIIDFALSNSGEKININFISTEPLLDFDLIKEIIIYAEEKARHDKTISFSIYTNGLLIDSQKCRFFREHEIKLFISYDGKKSNSRLNYRIMRGIKTAFSEGVDFDLVTTITKKNINDWKNIMRIYIKFKRKRIIFRKANFFGAGKPSIFLDSKQYISFWERYLQHLFKINSRKISIGDATLMTFASKILNLKNAFAQCSSPYCKAFKTFIIYDCDGTILPCDEARNFKNEFKLGSVLERMPLKIPSYYERQNNPSCLRCNIDWCGSCPVYVYANFKSKTKNFEDDLCIFYKEGEKVTKTLLSSKNKKIILGWLSNC